VGTRPLRSRRGEDEVLEKAGGSGTRRHHTETQDETLIGTEGALYTKEDHYAKNHCTRHPIHVRGKKKNQVGALSNAFCRVEKLKRMRERVRHKGIIKRSNPGIREKDRKGGGSQKRQNRLHANLPNEGETSQKRGCRKHTKRDNSKTILNRGHKKRLGSRQGPNSTG